MDFAKRHIEALTAELDGLKDRTDPAGVRKRQAVIGRLAKWQRLAWRSVRA